MPVKNLLVVKEKYCFLNISAISEIRTSNSKVYAKCDTFSAKELLSNEVVIKKIIAALEVTVKVLEKKIQNLKNIKEQKGKNVR